MAESGNQASSTVVGAHILVSGRVQGVGYRAFAWAEASRLGLSGGVRNLEDGRVEVKVEAASALVGAFIELLRKGPPRAAVAHVSVTWVPVSGQWNDFHLWT